MAKMAQRQLSGAFEAWVSTVQEVRARADEKQQKLRAASSVALRMAERGVCSAMGAWHEVMVLRRRQARALKHWIERSLAAAYMRWAEHAAEARVQRQLLSK